MKNPLAALYSLSKTKLQLVDELVEAGLNKYVTREIKKTCYKLQKYTLVLTYEDFEAGEWKMLMPGVRESLSTGIPAILSIVERTGKHPNTGI